MSKKDSALQQNHIELSILTFILLMVVAIAAQILRPSEFYSKKYSTASQSTTRDAQNSPEIGN